MPLALASSRGAFLKARLAVNGIQCAARSLGTLTAAGVGLLSSMAGLFKFWRVLGRGGFCGKLAASLRDGNANTPLYFRSIRRFEDRLAGCGLSHTPPAPIQNTSPSESSVSSQRKSVCG